MDPAPRDIENHNSVLWDGDSQDQVFVDVSRDSGPNSSHASIPPGGQPPDDGISTYISGLFSSPESEEDAAAANFVMSPSYSLVDIKGGNDFIPDNPSHDYVNLHRPASHVSRDSHSSQRSHLYSRHALGQVSGSNISPYTLRENIDNPNASKNTYQQSCECLQELTSSLFSLSSRAGPPTSTRDFQFVPMSIDTFLAVHKESMAKCECVVRCHSACFLRREYATLLTMNMEQVAKLQLDFAMSIGNSQDGRRDLFELPPKPKGHHTPGPDDSGNGLRRPQSPPSSMSKQTMSIGRFVIDDASEEAMIVVHLLGARMQQLKSFIIAARSELMQADLNECCARLDSIIVALGKTARDITARPYKGLK
ncbi:hypothetical protein F5Y05DRAFT_418566 [Hypoxylon sp. FL0543]|nr:hypothetical protein F5Y05DRAFT_418566 [Hypoxylon sp. FL0543]